MAESTRKAGGSRFLFKLLRVAWTIVGAVAISIVVVASRIDKVQGLVRDARSDWRALGTAKRLLDTGPFRPRVIAKGFGNVWDLEFPNERTIYVVERNGAIRRIVEGRLEDRPYHVFSDALEKPSTTHTGMYDLALHPRYRENGLVYALYAVSHLSDVPFHDANYAEDSGHWFPRLRLSVLHDTGKGFENERVLLETDPAINTTSAGGRMKFGVDGKLYVSTPFLGMLNSSQDLGSLLGKVLRLNDDGSVPTDNPFVDRPGARPEIYSIGHKDVSGLATDPETGEMFAAEHGPSGDQYFRAHGFDEINRIVAGGNSGFPDSFGPWVAPGTIAPLYYSVNPEPPGDMIRVAGDRYAGWRGKLLVSSMGTGTVGGYNLRMFEILPGGKLSDPVTVWQGARLGSLSRWFARVKGVEDFGRLRAVGQDASGIVYVGTGNSGPGDRLDMVVKLDPKQ